MASTAIYFTTVLNFFFSTPSGLKVGTFRSSLSLRIASAARVLFGYIEYIRYPDSLQLKSPPTKELEKILDLRRMTDPGI
jgi:hypothetical protein